MVIKENLRKKTVIQERKHLQFVFRILIILPQGK